MNTRVMQADDTPENLIDALPEDIALESDAALLAQAQAGDYLAFAELRERYEPQIQRFVRRITGQDDAEDIAQETFITLFKHLHDIDPPEKLRPYLFRVARNRCYDVLRKRQRYESVTLDEEPAEALASTLHHQENIQPEDAAHWVLLMIEVQDVIDKLPESQRQALIMYAEEGLSYGEIAEIMGCSLGTIKSRLFYAKRTLRQRLHPDTLAALESSFDAEHGDDE